MEQKQPITLLVLSLFWFCVFAPTSHTNAKTKKLQTQNHSLLKMESFSLLMHGQQRQVRLLGKQYQQLLTIYQKIYQRQSTIQKNILQKLSSNAIQSKMQIHLHKKHRKQIEALTKQIKILYTQIKMLAQRETVSKQKWAKIHAQMKDQNKREQQLKNTVKEQKVTLKKQNERILSTQKSIREYVNENSGIKVKNWELVKQNKKLQSENNKLQQQLERLRNSCKKKRRLKIPIGQSPTWGPTNAKVTIFSFSDFECPFCNRGANTIDQIKKNYVGKIRIVFKHFPLPFHRHAHLAAQASMAAHAQGKFWQFHDKLFANNRNLNKANFLKWAKELRLDVAKFKAALDNGKYKKYVDKDKAFASSVGANGTPTFFINGQKLVGAQPLARFKQMIDAHLQK